MRKVVTMVMTLALAALAASPAWAQGRGQGRGGMMNNPAMLLMQESVQKELKLDEAQTKKVTEYGEKARDMFQGFQDLSPEERREKGQEMQKLGESLVKDTLKPEQSKRLKQIGLQRGGAQVFTQKEVVDELKITDEQKGKIGDIQQDSREAMREAFQNNQGDQDGMRKAMDTLRKETMEKVAKVLTDEQKTKWKDMVGEEFKGEIRFGFGRGGN